MSKRGVSIAFFPTSWGFGAVRIRNKSMLMVGPFRLCLHRVTKTLASYGAK